MASLGLGSLRLMALPFSLWLTGGKHQARQRQPSLLAMGHNRIGITGLRYTFIGRKCLHHRRRQQWARQNDRHDNNHPRSVNQQSKSPTLLWLKEPQGWRYAQSQTGDRNPQAVRGSGLWLRQEDLRLAAEQWLSVTACQAAEVTKGMSPSPATTAPCPSRPATEMPA